MTAPTRSDVRHSFTDPITHVNVTLVIPEGGQVFPTSGEPKIGVEHQGCPERADLALEYDAFYCARCRWSGRITGAWAVAMIEAARPLSAQAALLREALLPLCDVLDEDEGPVILAYGVDRLAYALDDRLAGLGYVLTDREAQS